MPPGIAFEQMRFRVFRGEAAVAQGRAERSSLRRDTTDLLAEGLQVRLPGRTGEPDILISAPSARGNLRASRFEVWGGVVLTQGSVQGETERASYDGADGLVRGDRPVRIAGGGISLAGPGFVLDPRAGSIRIRGGGSLDARGVR